MELKLEFQNKKLNIPELIQKFIIFNLKVNKYENFEKSNKNESHIQ